MTDDFHYSHLLPEKAPIILKNPPTLKQCSRCNVGFTTCSRVKKRCDACQSIVDKASIAKSTEKLKQQRAQRRLAQDLEPR